MSQVYLGQIIQGGWTFSPRGFSLCAGQLLSVTQNAALFSLLGTNFGGNGIQNFGLPDLQGRAAVGTGQGSGLSNYILGEKVGTENVTLTSANLAPHTHPASFTPHASLTVADAVASQAQAAASGGSILARSHDGSTVGSAPQIYAPATTTPTTTLGGLNVAGTVAVGPNTGGPIPVSVIQPVQAVTTVIALQGVFPSRN